MTSGKIHMIIPETLLKTLVH